MLAGILTVGSYQLVALTPWARFVMMISPLMAVFVLFPCGQLHLSPIKPSYIKGMWCAGATMLLQASWEFHAPIEFLAGVTLMLSYLVLQLITASLMLSDLAPGPRITNYALKTLYSS